MRAVLARGALAGAAGTTALNTVTYLDMAIRGRQPSDLPKQAVETVADAVGVELPGEADTRRNRLDGLGPLGGTAIGVLVGVGAGLLRPVLVRLPTSLAGLLVGAAAMAATDVPMARSGLTDPKEWSTADWISDIVPHAAFGLVTIAALRRT